MATANSAQRQTINTQLILIGFAAMTIAFAFVAVLTNMIVNSKVNAIARSYQNNPVTVAAAPQTNTVGATSCVAPSTTAVVSDPVTGTQTNVLGGVGGSSSASWVLPLGNYSQSNSSTTNTTSNNTFIKDSYNTTNTTTTTTNNTDNSDHSVDTSHSGNTHTDVDVDVDVNNTTTTTNTDNSNNSVNTDSSNSNNTSTVTNTNNQNIGNTNNQNNEGNIGNNNDGNIF